jgi:hypothetical protein
MTDQIPDDDWVDHMHWPVSDWTDEYPDNTEEFVVLDD